MRSRVRAPASRIKVSNQHDKYKINEPLVKNIAAKILRVIKKEKKAEFELVFLSDRAIRKLNNEYKSEDHPTDVLSFRIDRKEFGEKRFLGEIFISIDTARRNSKVFGTDIGEEAVLYIIHGILHLFGYDDLRARDRLCMSGKQEKILCQLRKRQNLSKVLTPR